MSSHARHRLDVSPYRLPSLPAVSRRTAERAAWLAALVLTALALLSHGHHGQPHAAPITSPATATVSFTTGTVSARQASWADKPAPSDIDPGGKVYEDRVPLTTPAGAALVDYAPTGVATYADLSTYDATGWHPQAATPVPPLRHAPTSWNTFHEACRYAGTHYTLCYRAIDQGNGVRVWMTRVVRCGRTVADRPSQVVLGTPVAYDAGGVPFLDRTAVL